VSRSQARILPHLRIVRAPVPSRTAAAVGRRGVGESGLLVRDLEPGDDPLARRRIHGGTISK